MAPTSEKVSNNIPDDLAFRIFSKLPVKSLKRFACVSKSWSNLFENPHFMSIYQSNIISKFDSENAGSCLLLKQSMQNCEHNYMILLSGERFENRVKLDWPPPFQDNDSNIFILGSTSVNGILCLYQGMGTAPAPEIGLKIVLWNPSTEKFKVIPSGHIACPLGFDIYVELHGFGYDHVTDDYKVIRYSEFFEKPYYFQDVSWDIDRPRDPMPLWQIYSQRTNSWRKLDNTNLVNSVPVPSRFAVYLNGMCHWWANKVYSKQAVLVSFNMCYEVVLETPLPLDGQGIFPLVELNGSIAFISYLPKTNTFNVSILGELGVKESWTKLFTFGSLPSNQILIGVGTKWGIFFGRYCEDDVELNWFNLSTLVIEEIGVKGDALFCQIVTYKEILLPVKGVNM